MCRDLRHFGAGADLDAHRLEQALGCLGYAFRQSTQDVRRGLDQDNADIAMRINPIEPVGDHFADRAVQFCGQFGAGRARTNDRNVELAGKYRPFPRLHSQAGIDQAPVEALGLRLRFQRYRLFGDARSAEIVGMLPTAITSVS